MHTRERRRHYPIIRIYLYRPATPQGSPGQGWHSVEPRTTNLGCTRQTQMLHPERHDLSRRRVNHQPPRTESILPTLAPAPLPIDQAIALNRDANRTKRWFTAAISMAHRQALIRRVRHVVRNRCAQRHLIRALVNACPENGHLLALRYIL